MWVVEWDVRIPFWVTFILCALSKWPCSEGHYGAVFFVEPARAISYFWVILMPIKFFARAANGYSGHSTRWVKKSHFGGLLAQDRCGRTMCWKNIKYGPITRTQCEPYTIMGRANDLRVSSWVKLWYLYICDMNLIIKEFIFHILINYYNMALPLVCLKD